MRPRGLLPSTVAIGVLNLTAFINLNWAHKSIVVITLLTVFLSYLLLWCFWVGRNWARLVFLFLSVVAVINLFTLIHPPGNVALYGTGVVAWALLGLFLLFWLNRTDVREWFKSPKPGSRRQSTPVA